MKKVYIGQSQLMVSPLAFGGNVLGWTINQKKSFEVLDAFVAGGGNFIDTADIYARWATGIGGESETIIGEWMRQRKNRKHIILATKVGMDMGGNKTGLAKKYILKAVDESLMRLQTDYIDLYQSHKDDERTPVEETLEAYQLLIQAGKIRYIGASNYSAKRLNAALEAAQKYNLPAYVSLQPHYNLMERKVFETEIEKICLDNKLGVINYFPLASGFLTGKYRSEKDTGKSVRGGGLTKYLNQRGFNILKALDSVADKHACKPASIALAWYLARPCITAPIASATSPEQLKDLLIAPGLRLSAEDLELINSCSAY